MIPIQYSDKGLYLYYDSYSDLPQKALYVYIRMSTGYYIYKSGRKKILHCRVLRWRWTKNWTDQKKWAKILPLYY